MIQKLLFKQKIHALVWTISTPVPVELATFTKIRMKQWYNFATQKRNNLTDIHSVVKVLLLFLSSQNIEGCRKTIVAVQVNGRTHAHRSQDGSHISVIGVPDARQNKIIGNLTEMSARTLRSTLDGVYEKRCDADDACKWSLGISGRYSIFINFRGHPACRM